jgi:hypothetical protein
LQLFNLLGARAQTGHDRIGASAFVDSNFPMPERSVAAEMRHDWIAFPQTNATQTPD